MFVAEHEVVCGISQKLNMSLAITADKKADNLYFIGYGSPMTMIQNNYLCTKFFPTFDNYIQTFTCYTVPILSFNFYVSAFDNLVCVLITVSVIALAVFVKCYVFHNTRKSLKFSMWLFYFSIFTEEKLSVRLMINKDKVYRTATILWLLSTHYFLLLFLVQPLCRLIFT